MPTKLKVCWSLPDKIATMPAAFTERGLRLIALVTLVGVVVLVFVHFFGPAASQSRNLTAAREHASRLEPEAHRDARFTNIHLGAYTGNGGCLWVVGTIFSEKDSNELRHWIDASRSPVRIKYSITVFPMETKVNR
jgi:hypothetical protein